MAKVRADKEMVLRQRFRKPAIEESGERMASVCDFDSNTQSSSEL